MSKKIAIAAVVALALVIGGCNGKTPDNQFTDDRPTDTREGVIHLNDEAVATVDDGNARPTRKANPDLFNKDIDLDVVLYGRSTIQYGPGPDVRNIIHANLEGRVRGNSIDHLKERAKRMVTLPDFLKSGEVTGPRSRENIHKVFELNAASLRYAYNRRLREKPDMRGKGIITVKFAVDDSGKVLYAQTAGSTMDDPELEQVAVKRVLTWDFGHIDSNPGGVTEVTFPIHFSRE